MEDQPYYQNKAKKVLFKRLEATTKTLDKFTLVVPKKSWSVMEVEKLKADFTNLIQGLGYSVITIQYF